MRQENGGCYEEGRNFKREKKGRKGGKFKGMAARWRRSGEGGSVL